MKVIAKARHIPQILSDLGGGQTVRWEPGPDCSLDQGLHWLVGRLENNDMVPFVSLHTALVVYRHKDQTLTQQGMALSDMTAVEDYEDPK